MFIIFFNIPNKIGKWHVISFNKKFFLKTFKNKLLTKKMTQHQKKILIFLNNFLVLIRFFYLKRLGDKINGPKIPKPNEGANAYGDSTTGTFIETVFRLARLARFNT